MGNRLQECSQKKISFKNVRIWNGLAESIDAGIDCLTFENGQVTSVGSSGELGSDCQDYSQDMSGVTLIPGLIDAHIHLCLNPEQKDPLAQEDPGRDALLEQMSARARLMLEAGITTARDLGGGQWLELEIRDRINRGEIPGPRLICSGQPITSVKGHCHFWRGEARDVDEAIEVLGLRDVLDIAIVAVDSAAISGMDLFLRLDVLSWSSLRPSSPFRPWLAKGRRLPISIS